MSKALRLAGFKYLKRQRILTLALMVSAASMLFSITALSLLGFYRGFTAYLGEGEDIVAVYSQRGGTPYTGLVPAYLTEKLAVVDGVLAISPEVIAPCLVNGKAVFLRGVIPEKFVRLNPLKVLEGISINLNDTGSVMVGRNLAERLGVKLNDRLLFLGVLAERYVEMRVAGIFKAGSAMDDEVLASLYVGQWLRGTDYNTVTLIRLKIDRNTQAPSKIYEVIAAEASKQSQPSQPSQDNAQPSLWMLPIPWATTFFNIEDVGVEYAFKFMQSYMDRYGVTREALLTLSAAVFFFSSFAIISASKTIMVQHSGEINVLRSLGMSKKHLKIDMLVKLLPWILASSIIGALTASALLSVMQGFGYLQVLSHTIPFQLDLLVIVLNLVLSFTLVSAAILKSEI